MTDDQKVCFVVMGFGKKTDFVSGRTLDLDATYEEIIKPAVTDYGMRCVRANEILTSGVIDVKMYEMLLRSDLVIADISTGNINAVYELGVRHALKPFSTIIMAESKATLHFDLNHIYTFQYEHMGDQIASSEAKRASGDLLKLIKNCMGNTDTDSPVYTFMPKLAAPVLTDDDFAELLDEVDAVEETFSNFLSSAEAASNDSNHALAYTKFNQALEMNPNNHYLRQQAALHHYKSKKGSEFLALMNANTILAPLDPENSNDPETLGISGAIHKRLWLINADPETLNRAVDAYKRGFEVRGDYYNGENAATCLDLRSAIQSDKNEALFDTMSARKIREEIIETLSLLVEGDDFAERSDRMWIFASLSTCLLANGDLSESEIYKTKFLESEPVEWQIETFKQGQKPFEQA